MPASPPRPLNTGALTACAFVVAHLVAASSQAQEIAIVPRVRTGDAFQVSLVRVRENSAQPQRNIRSQTLVSVRVLSATAAGYVLEWAPGRTEFDNPQAANDPLVVGALDAVRDVRLQLTLNAQGELTGLANRAEVAPKLQAVVNTITQALAAQLPPEQRSGMLNMVNQVLSPDLIIAGATREAAIYFGLNGVSLAQGEDVTIPVDQPSPFGGGSIPSTFRVRLTAATADEASLVTDMTYDPAALQRMTAALAKQSGAPIPAEALASLPPIQMADEGTYRFDRRVGLMREVVMSRRITAAGARRVDGWEIRLVQGP